MIHARDLTTSNLHLAKGRHVVVIGSGKSALDASVAAAEVAASTKNVFKTVCRNRCSGAYVATDSSITMCPGSTSCLCHACIA